MQELGLGAEGRTSEGTAVPPCTDCVVLTCFMAQFQFVFTLLRHSGIRLHHAGSIEQADFLLTVTEATVVLSDTAFLDGGWQDCLEMLSKLHPSVSLVLAAEEIEVPSLADALERGVQAITRKPFRMSELQRVLRASHEAAIEAAARRIRPRS